MMATAVEALIGAVYEDGGEDAAIHVMDHIGLTQGLVMSKYPSPLQHTRGLPLLTNMLLPDTGCGRPREPP